jgi:hypothetical protein
MGSQDMYVSLVLLHGAAVCSPIIKTWCVASIGTPSIIILGQKIDYFQVIPSESSIQRGITTKILHSWNGPMSNEKLDHLKYPYIYMCVYM